MGARQLASEDVFDITIIGGGPTGQYAAYCAGLRGLTTKIIERMPELGGRLTALYAETRISSIYDATASQEILAKDLVKVVNEELKRSEPTIVLNTAVVSLDPGKIIRLIDSSGTIHRTRSVLITAGSGAFTPRKLDAPGAARLEGRGVYYNLHDLAPFAGKRALVIGGGDNAFNATIDLAGSAASIVHIHRSEIFRAGEPLIAKARRLPIDLRTFYELREVHGDEQVEAATIFDNRTQVETRIACDAILLYVGFYRSIGPIYDWELDTTDRMIKVTPRMETSVPGVFAAGDIAAYPGKLEFKILATDFAEAAIAVDHAEAYVASLMESSSGSPPSTP